MSRVRVTQVLERSRASGTSRLVLVAIAELSWDGSATCARDEIARLANCPRRSVPRAVANLVAAGELVVEYDPGRENTYVVTL